MGRLTSIALAIAPVPKAAGVDVHVIVEDTSYADAPARPVLHHMVPASPSDDGVLQVELHDLPLEEHATYTVRVHVDMDSDGRISAGDLIAMESYPVAARMEIRLRPVARVAPPR